MWGRTWRSPKCNVLIGYGSAITIADVFSAFLNSPNYRCRARRWILAHHDLGHLVPDAPKVRAVCYASTAKVIARSVFGSPIYVVDDDMFYGQDRRDLVERTLRQPVRKVWF